MEASTLAAQQTFARRGLETPQTKVSFPFYSSFRKVQEIHDAIEPLKRAPGRPKSSASLLQ